MIASLYLKVRSWAEEKFVLVIGDWTCEEGIGCRFSSVKLAETWVLHNQMIINLPFTVHLLTGLKGIYLCTPERF